MNLISFVYMVTL